MGRPSYLTFLSVSLQNVLKIDQIFLKISTIVFQNFDNFNKTFPHILLKICPNFTKKIFQTLIKSFLFFSLPKTSSGQCLSNALFWAVIKTILISFALNFVFRSWLILRRGQRPTILLLLKKNSFRGYTKKRKMKYLSAKRKWKK